MPPRDTPTTNKAPVVEQVVEFEAVEPVVVEEGVVEYVAEPVVVGATASSGGGAVKFPEPVVVMPPVATVPKPNGANIFCRGCGKSLASASAGLNALGGMWHKECFKCSLCGERLFSFSRFFEDNGKPVCAKCNNASLPVCRGCKQKMTGEYVIAMEKPYHPQCLKCGGCGKLFGDEGFYEDRGQLWHLQCAPKGH